MASAVDHPMTFSAFPLYAWRLLVVLLRRPEGLLRALARCVAYLEAVTLGSLAQVVVWDRMAEAFPHSAPPPPPPRPGQRAGRLTTDAWGGLIDRTLRLIALLGDQEAARRQVARRVARRPQRAARLIARGERASAKPPPDALFRLPPLPPETDPDSS